jgi:hypothetical protein
MSDFYYLWLDDEKYPYWVNVYDATADELLEMNDWCEQIPGQVSIVYQNDFDHGEHLRYTFKRRIDAIRFVLENIVTNQTITY